MPFLLQQARLPPGRWRIGNITQVFNNLGYGLLCGLAVAASAVLWFSKKTPRMVHAAAGWMLILELLCFGCQQTEDPAYYPKIAMLNYRSPTGQGSSALSACPQLSAETQRLHNIRGCGRGIGPASSTLCVKSPIRSHPAFPMPKRNGFMPAVCPRHSCVDPPSSRSFDMFHALRHFPPVTARRAGARVSRG